MQRAKHENPSFFVAVSTWAHDNRDTIDPLTAIGALGAAVILAVVTSFLWGATKNLATSTEDLAVAATGQIAEMTLARNLAERQLDLTQKRFLLTGRQVDLAEKQHGLQREQYFASHRPQMTIHQIRLIPDHSGARPDEAPLQAEFAIINSGTSAGTVISSSAELSYLYPDEIMPLRRMRHNYVIPPVLFDVGTADTRRIDGDDLSGMAHAEAGDRTFTKRLYFRGWMLYADSKDRRRTTYFCWEYDSILERFRPIGDPEANATY